MVEGVDTPRSSSEKLKVVLLTRQQEQQTQRDGRFCLAPDPETHSFHVITPKSTICGHSFGLSEEV